MRYLKALGASLVAVAALMAIAGTGTASATVLCSTTGETCPAGQKWSVNTVLDFSVPSGGSTKLTETGGGLIDECTMSTIQGKITNAGSSTTTVTAEIEKPTWNNCTFTTSTLEGSKLEIHKIAGTSNGTVTSDSTFNVTVNTVLFGSCIYGVDAGTDLGEITEGNPAVFHANAIFVKRGTGCLVGPSTALWTGTYNVTSPATTLSVSSS